MKLKTTTGANALRASGMLLGFSVFILVNAIVRLTLLVATYHGSEWRDGDDEDFPVPILLSAAVLEVVVGLVGLLQALAVIMFDFQNAAVTRFSVFLMLSAWSALVVFVFAEPAYRVRHTEKSTVRGLTLDQYEVVVTLGILGSLAYCGALQGGQAFFAWQLWRVEKGAGEMYTRGYYCVRLAFYSVLAFVAGLSQLAIGTLVREELGQGRLSHSTGMNETIVARPYFIVYPELNISAGLLVTFAALVGLGRAVFPSSNGRGAFAGLWVLTWLIQILFMSVTQLGLWADGKMLERREVVLASGLLVVQTLSLSILPPYMDAMMYHAETASWSDEEAGWA